jgi:glycerophosphoryl diester phosphodiesterase
MPQTRPLVIAHRGASGYRPEHTIEAYRLAIEQGADVIEPDLVMTRDRVLVARHENEIGGTTDVAVKFPDRRRTKVIDGETVTGWFVEDLAIAELKTLRARERLPFRTHEFDGRFEIPTFEEILRFVRDEERRLGRRIGLYPETKHPSHHEALGLPITDSVLALLARFGYRSEEDPVFIQSFEVANLERARTVTRLRLVQLIADSGRPADFAASGDGRDYADLITPAGLREIATYADGIGPAKSLVQPVGADGSLLEPTRLVRDAHAAGLLVHVWTLRREPIYLPKAYGGDLSVEVNRLVSLGVDGLFTDFPDLVVAAVGRR